jgi:hypothetical protein
MAEIIEEAVDLAHDKPGDTRLEISGRRPTLRLWMRSYVARNAISLFSNL